MNLDVICVGVARFDIFVNSKDVRSSQMARSEVLELSVGSNYKIDHAVYEVGGSGINSAIVFARQGIKAGCIARTGQDHLSNQLKVIAKHENLEPGLFINNPEHHSDMSIHLVTERNHELTLTYENSFNAMRSKNLRLPGVKAGLLYMAELPVNFRLYEHLVAWAKINCIDLAINLKNFHNYHQKQMNYVLSTASKILMPIAYAYEVFNETRDPLEIIRQLNAFGATSVVLYDVAREAYAYEDNTVYSCGVYKKLNPLDMTGCDDVFCAGYLAADMRQMSVPDALTMASAMSCSVSEVFGARAGILKKPALRTINIQTEVL